MVVYISNRNRIIFLYRKKHKQDFPLAYQAFFWKKNIINRDDVKDL